MNRVLAVLMWCVVSVGCVADEVKKSADISQSTSIPVNLKSEENQRKNNMDFSDEDWGMDIVIDTLDSDLCVKLHRFLDSRKKLEELGESIEVLSQIDGVEMLDWKLVSAEKYKHIVIESLMASGHEKISKSYQPDSNAKFYLARVNFDNFDVDEYILRREEVGYSGGRFYVLKDSESLHSYEKHVWMGRVFKYNGVVLYIDISSKNANPSLGIRYPKRTSVDDLDITHHTICAMQ